MIGTASATLEAIADRLSNVMLALADRRSELARLDEHHLDLFKVAEAHIDLTIANDRTYTNETTRKAAARLQAINLPGRTEYQETRAELERSIMHLDASVSSLRVQFTTAQLLYMAEHSITNTPR